jgi:voltage-gated potassium channel
VPVQKYFPVVGRANILERRLSKFLSRPPTVASAARVIVAAVGTVTIAGGVAIWLVDRSEYPNVWVGLWWSIQTAATVGYGDVTPAHTSGRIVGAIMMLWGLAFLAIVTAIITTTFITRARIELQVGVAEDVKSTADTDVASMNARFDALEEKLDRLETAIRESSSG